MWPFTFRMHKLSFTVFFNSIHCPQRTNSGESQWSCLQILIFFVWICRCSFRCPWVKHQAPSISCKKRIILLLLEILKIFLKKISQRQTWILNVSLLPQLLQGIQSWQNRHKCVLQFSCCRLNTSLMPFSTVNICFFFNQHTLLGWHKHEPINMRWSLGNMHVFCIKSWTHSHTDCIRLLVIKQKWGLTFSGQIAIKCPLRHLPVYNNKYSTKQRKFNKIQLICPPQWIKCIWCPLLCSSYHQNFIKCPLECPSGW